MQKDYRRTGFCLTTLIENLYGSVHYRKVKDNRNSVSMKKYYLKITKSIKYAIEETISVTDNTHKKELKETILRFEQAMNKAKSFEELDQCMIAYQTELIFLLLGSFPRRLNVKDFANKRNMWNLNGYRQIQYLQTDEQKKNLIFKAVQGKYQNRFGDWGSFTFNIYTKECKKEPAILVDWIRINHPDIYLDLF